MRMIVKKSRKRNLSLCRTRGDVLVHDFAKAILKENQIELKLMESLSPKEGVQRPPI